MTESLMESGHLAEDDEYLGRKAMKARENNLEEFLLYLMMLNELEPKGLQMVTWRPRHKPPREGIDLT